MPVHITLSGNKAERFEMLKEELTEELGYEPSNPEVIGVLMSGVDAETVDVMDELLSSR